MKKKTIEQTVKKEIIILNGDLTIQKASDVREQLLNALRQNDHLVIDMKNIREYDLTFLQLLIALRKSVDESGKTLTVVTGNNQMFYDLLKSSGYPQDKWFKIEPVISNNKGENNE